MSDSLDGQLLKYKYEMWYIYKWTALYINLRYGRSITSQETISKNQMI